MESSVQSSSNVTPLGFLVLVVLSVLTWGLRRRNALMPLLIMTCYMPLGQEIVVAGLNLQFFRILLLVGLCRVWARKETGGLRRTTMDKLFIWWAIVTIVVGTLADLTVSRFVNRTGMALNALGVYFLVRCWVRNFEDAAHGVRFLAFMIVPLAVSMIVEKFTHRNIFSVFGGVAEFAGLRDGKLRCQGAFRHPILAGTYGATLFPLFVGLWFSEGRKKWRAALGACSAIVVTIAAASSGALLALIFSVMGLALWRFRHKMRLVRRGVVVMLILFALVMNAPVWYLFARLSDIVGGTGWYRSYIIDMAIQHFDEWWLVGSTYTAHWAPAGEVVTGDPNNMDIINNFVAEALGGGMLKLGLFIGMIVVGFRIIGRWASQPKAIMPVAGRMLIWSFGVCLFTHCVSFLSVSYFDQIVVMWYWLLAVISVLSVPLAGALKRTGSMSAHSVAGAAC